MDSIECQYCNKSFSNFQNKTRHEKTCKCNGEISIQRDSTERLFREQIDYLKEQINELKQNLKMKDDLFKEQMQVKDEQIKELMKSKDEMIKDKDTFIFSMIKSKDEQLMQKDEMIMSMIEKLNSPQVREVKEVIREVVRESPKKIKQTIKLPEIEKENIVMEIDNKQDVNLVNIEVFEEEEPEETKVYKPKLDKYETYLNEVCSDSYTFTTDDYACENNFKNVMSDLYPIETFSSTIESSATSMYKKLIDKVFSQVDLTKLPFQIQSNKPKQQVGYIKKNNQFEKYYGDDLINEIQKIIKGPLNKVMTNTFNQYKFEEGYYDEYLYKQSTLEPYETFDETPYYTQEYKKLHQETTSELMMSICFLEFNADGVPDNKKCLNTLAKYIMDKCIIRL